MQTLENLKEKLIIKEVTILGETWNNQRVELLFDNLVEDKFTLDIIEYVINEVERHNSSFKLLDTFTKGQIKKLNSICLAKTEKQRQKRVLSYSNLLTNGIYNTMFNKSKIDTWIALCKKYNLESGLFKISSKELSERITNMVMRA